MFKLEGNWDNEYFNIKWEIFWNENFSNGFDFDFFLNGWE